MIPKAGGTAFQGVMGRSRAAVRGKEAAVRGKEAAVRGRCSNSEGRSRIAGRKKRAAESINIFFKAFKNVTVLRQPRGKLGNHWNKGKQ